MRRRRPRGRRTSFLAGNGKKGRRLMTEWAQVGRAQGAESTMKSSPRVDARKARVCFPGDHVMHYDDQKLADALWLALPRRTRAAFRGANDPRPVYPWDYARVP